MVRGFARKVESHVSVLYGGSYMSIFDTSTDDTRDFLTPFIIWIVPSLALYMLIVFLKVDDFGFSLGNTIVPGFIFVLIFIATNRWLRPIDARIVYLVCAVLVTYYFVHNQPGYYPVLRRILGTVIR